MREVIIVYINQTTIPIQIRVYRGHVHDHDFDILEGISGKFIGRDDLTPYQIDFISTIRDRFYLEYDHSLNHSLDSYIEGHVFITGETLAIPM